MKFDYRGAGAGVFVVGEGPAGVIYGSTAMPLELFSYDPRSRRMTNPGNPTSVGGEIYFEGLTSDAFNVNPTTGAVSPRRPLSV
jgi:hypothetical protein